MITKISAEIKAPAGHVRPDSYKSFVQQLDPAASVLI
jgi:hypothetical protein